MIHQAPGANSIEVFEDSDLPSRVKAQPLLCRGFHSSRNGVNSSLLVAGGWILLSSSLLSSLELSDTEVYDPSIRARLETAAHSCAAVVPKLVNGCCPVAPSIRRSTRTLWGRFLWWSRGCFLMSEDLGELSCERALAARVLSSGDGRGGGGLHGREVSVGARVNVCVCVCCEY